MPLIGETSTEQNQHLEVIEVLEGIMEAIRANAQPLQPTEPPVVNVALEPSKVVVDRTVTQPPSYRFTIDRDRQGRIANITAEPINV